MDFDWDRIRAFLAVMDHGSLTKAARELGISQPTLGRHVQALEDTLGVVLFERTGRVLVPTDVAHDLEAHGRVMEEAAAQLGATAEGRSAQLDGTVRLTASENVASFLLPPILQRLMDHHPSIEVELVATNESQNLLVRDADIAIRMVEPTQQDLMAKRIGELRTGLYAHASYLERHGAFERIEDMHQHRILGYDRSPLMLHAMRSMGLSVDRSFFSFRCDNQNVHVHLLAAGGGLVATMSRIAEGLPGVVRVLPSLRLPPLPVYLVAHRELRTSVRIRTVFDQLADELAAVCAADAAIEAA